MRQRYPSNPCSLFQAPYSATLCDSMPLRKLEHFLSNGPTLVPLIRFRHLSECAPPDLPPISPMLALTYRSGTLYPKPSFFRTKVSVFLVSLEAGIG